ncbi:hypothetical protein [Tautonia plasticadhaerens]|uniref:Twin-arginine translocation signal domain-containing protein n=1 Tax=Tautonia plasticadhaerens TaxID=2527974 RepID=A0A518GZV9_9BACT|nr:hypothetical protein [Tautonia plasticadhaerens]QDV34118.1 hypothetical protein ElP_20010 [Tautonia plasticadhaerens]
MRSSPSRSRREFLQSASALGLGAGLGPWAVLGPITPARASEMAVGPEAVRFRPEIEPVVRWIEETPRDRILDVAVERLGGGLPYRDLLSGLFLAGIRNVKPRPVGFKFHAVMVINSAHLLGQTAPVGDRLLPLLWALDYFKSSQAQDVEEGDWTLSKVDEARVPGPSRAVDELEGAFEAWDADAADAATAGVCRSQGAAAAMEPFWRCAVRDWRNIGHKPIFAMQCWRTLQAIGWENAEPVLRSLSFGILDTQGSSPGAEGPYEANLELARSMRPDWTAGRLDPGATEAMLDAMRSARPGDSSAEAARLIGEGISPDSLWDAVVLAGSELLLKEPGIIPLHAVTSANALHFIYHNASDPTTRSLALLQAAGWVPLFRDRMDLDATPVIDRIEPIAPEAEGEQAVAAIFEAIGDDHRKAAAMIVGYLDGGGPAEPIFAAARSSIFRKGRDSHDYKYGAAAWEEHQLASDPRWRPALAAAIAAQVPGSGTSDSPLMRRAQEAVGRIG